MTQTIGVNLRVTGNCSQGGRRYMEDMFAVAYQNTTNQKDLEYAFFGIFDGHGGAQAALYAKEHLMNNIVRMESFWEDNPRSVMRAIRNGFLATHFGMWNNIEKWPKTPHGLPSTSGTTASVLFIRRGKVYIGHVGDSGIILGEQDESVTPSDPNALGQWKAVPLTREHKPNSPDELTRIRESGGEVIMKGSVARVVWRRPNRGHKGPLTRSTNMERIPFLAVARSLGDLWSYNSETDMFIVSPMPDVRVLTLDLSKHRCLILGTDGLLNMLSPQEAVNLVEQAERSNIANGAYGKYPVTGWTNPAKHLVDSALKKWGKTPLRADNTSAVVLLLDPEGFQRKADIEIPDPYNEKSSIYFEIADSDTDSDEVDDEDEGEVKDEKDDKSKMSGMAISTWKTELKSEDKVKKEIVPPPQLPNKIEEDKKEDKPKPNKSSISQVESCNSNKKDVGSRRKRTREVSPERNSLGKRNAENVGPSMRLRSSKPVKTLRSRNVALEAKLDLFNLDEPSPKRRKK